MWATLPDFHPLLIDPHSTNGLEVTEFSTSMTLLESVLNRTAAGEKPNFGD
jgi:hypothetical protein